MATVPCDLYRGIQMSALGDEEGERDAVMKANDGAESAGKLHPRPGDVTIFKDANGIRWVRGVGNGPLAESAPVTDGVSLTGRIGSMGASWCYFHLPEGLPVPDNLRVHHTPSRKDKTHHSIHCLVNMTEEAFRGSVDNMARHAVALAVENGRPSIYHRIKRENS